VIRLQLRPAFCPATFGNILELRRHFCDGVDNTGGRGTRDAEVLKYPWLPCLARSAIPSQLGLQGRAI